MGPGNGKKWNASWPEEIEKAVSNSLWKLVTPGVLVIAALTDLSKYLVDVVDEEFTNVDIDIKYDIVAMYTVTPNANRAYMWAKHFKSQGTHVAIGGVHAAMCTDEALMNADTVLIGEGEVIWPEFLEDYSLGKAKKIYVQPIGELDLGKSPVPLFEYLPSNGRKIIPVQTARGCPHGCKFCNLRGIYGKGYRTKTIDQVMREIEAVLKINPNPIVYFTDDNLFCNRERSRELLNELMKYNFIWYANSDLSFSEDNELLKLAFKSGLRQVLIGFESINPKNLQGIDENNFKSSHFNSYKEVIEKVQSNGIGIIGSFIIGLDQDDTGIFDQMIRFSEDTHLYGMSITVNTPYPGTVTYEKYKNEGRILNYDWNNYTIFQPVIKPYNISVGELNEGYMRVLKEINMPANILKRLNYFKQQMKLLKA